MLAREVTIDWNASAERKFGTGHVTKRESGTRLQPPAPPLEL
jgi:hypothetical protein